MNIVKMGRPKKIDDFTINKLDEGEYYTIDELAIVLKISRRTIERQIKNGEIKAIKIGRQWRIRKKDFE